MGFLSKLLKIHKSSSERKEANDSYSAEISRCMIECKMSKTEMQLAELNYYKGYTSYKSFFKYVFMFDIVKIKKVLLTAKEKANNGCNIDFTFVRFKLNDRKFIDIPFEIFAETRDYSEEKLRMKLWHKANIKRIIVNNPNLSQMSTSELEESIKTIYEMMLIEKRTSDKE